jgi:hypothetical protein
VVEVATNADFHGVTLHGLFTTFEFEQFGPRRRAGPTRGQAGAKDVRHFHQLFVVTDRAGLTRRAPDILGGAQQLRVRVADVFVAQQPGGELGEQGVAHQSELNDCSVGSAGSKTLIH